MSAIALLKELRHRGVTLSVDRNELEVSAPKGVLSLKLREQLTERKSELIKLLSEVTAEPKHIPPLARGPEEREFIVSFAQQRLWFLHQLLPDNPFYNMRILWRLTGKLNVGASGRGRES